MLPSPFPSIGKILKIVAALIASLLVYIFVFPLFLYLLGYYPNGVGWDVAQKIMEKKGEVTDCRKIIHLIAQPFSPTEGEQRSNCIHEYAKLTKDPSACELLMPSSYGISCVGGAEESLPCDVESIPYSVYWRDGDIEHTEHLRSCMTSDTSRSTLGNACCEVAKVAFLKDHNDCTPLKSNQPAYDHCLYSLAWKLHDPSYCSDISKDNPRTACEVLTKALQKDPSICRGCRQAVGSVEELE